MEWQTRLIWTENVTAHFFSKSNTICQFSRSQMSGEKNKQRIYTKFVW